MKRVLKWIVVALLSLIAVMAIGGAALHFVGLNRLNNAPEVAMRAVAVPTNPAALARGEHLVNIVSSCGLCHGNQLEGQVFFDGELGSYVFAPNLTSVRAASALPTATPIGNARCATGLVRTIGYWSSCPPTIFKITAMQIWAL